MNQLLHKGNYVPLPNDKAAHAPSIDSGKKSPYTKYDSKIIDFADFLLYTSDFKLAFFILESPTSPPIFLSGNIDFLINMNSKAFLKVGCQLECSVHTEHCLLIFHPQDQHTFFNTINARLIEWSPKITDIFQSSSVSITIKLIENKSLSTLMSTSSINHASRALAGQLLLLLP